MVNLGINSIFMARNGVVELIPVLEELSHLCVGNTHVVKIVAS